MKRSKAGAGSFALAVVAALATTFASGCAGVPTFPTWQNISAEREERKQETLEHIDRTRSEAAGIEKAALSQGSDTAAAGAQGRLSAPPTSGPIDSALTGGMTVDPILGSPQNRPAADKALRSQADQAVAMGDLESAIELYRTLVTRQPNDGELRHSLALVAEQMGLHDEAALNYQQAVRLAPGEPLYRLCLEAHRDRVVAERRMSAATPTPATAPMPMQR